MANSCGWQQQASYPALNYNGYTTPVALHQEASFGHQFQGYSAAAAAAAMGHMNAAAAATANHLASHHSAWTNRTTPSLTKNELMPVVSSGGNGSTNGVSSGVNHSPQNPSANWSTSMTAVTDPYPFFSATGSHHHHHHHHPHHMPSVQHSTSTAGSAFAGPLSSLNPHSPTEPKSGYPYYGHQISGMEASMLCAGRVH